MITHRTLSATDCIRFVQDEPCALIRALKKEQGKGIWICGGRSIIQPLVQNGLIDEYYIAVISTILGSGVRLFGELPNEIRLRLIHAQVYNGISELVYACR